MVLRPTARPITPRYLGDRRMHRSVSLNDEDIFNIAIIATHASNADTFFFIEIISALTPETSLVHNKSVI